MAVTSSEAVGDLERMRHCFALALAWIEEAEGRSVNVYSPGHFKTQPLSYLLSWFPKRERFEADMACYVGD